MLAGYQITLPPQTLETAEGKTREVLDKALKQVGRAPIRRDTNPGQGGPRRM